MGTERLRKMYLAFRRCAWRIYQRIYQRATNYLRWYKQVVYKQLKEGQPLVANKLSLNFDNKYQRELAEIVCAMANKRRTGQLAQPAQIDEVTNFIESNMRYMTVEFLLRIETIAIVTGLFVLACSVRLKNYELVLRLAQSKNYLARRRTVLRNATQLFWCYLAQDDDASAAQLINHKDIRNNSEVAGHIRELCRSFGLLPADCAIPAPTGCVEMASVNAEFADFIRGKSVAVIGPSSCGADHSEEIKRDFDIIVRTTYQGRDKLPVEQRELVPHISYYNNGCVRKLFMNTEEYIGNLADLRFAVIKSLKKEWHERLRRYTAIRARNAGVNGGIKNFYFYGHDNSMQLILHDLADFEPSRVKVFYANCFLADMLWDDGYKLAEMNAVQERRWAGWAKHNLISNYDYVRQLYKRGLIEADPRLSEVLELGTAEYINQIEIQENSKFPVY